MRERKTRQSRLIELGAAAFALGALLAFSVPGSASAQSIPKINVDPVCHGIAQQAGTPSESGGPDLTFKRCVQSEMATREKLSREWSTFTPAEKSSCVGNETSALLPSYSDLITCVEMARAARKLSQ
jgi:hypothetical protein